MRRVARRYQASLGEVERASDFCRCPEMTVMNRIERSAEKRDRMIHGQSEPRESASAAASGVAGINQATTCLAMTTIETGKRGRLRLPWRQSSRSPTVISTNSISRIVAYPD